MAYNNQFTAVDEVNFRRDLEATYRSMFEDEVRHMQMQQRGVGVGPAVHRSGCSGFMHPDKAPVLAGTHGLKQQSASMEYAQAQLKNYMQEAIDPHGTRGIATHYLDPAPTPSRSKLLLLLKGN